MVVVVEGRWLKGLGFLFFFILDSLCLISHLPFISYMDCFLFACGHVYKCKVLINAKKLLLYLRLILFIVVFL